MGVGAGAGGGRRARFCLGRWPFKVGVPGTKARPENRPESLQFLRPRPPHPAPSHPGLPAAPRGPPLAPGGLRSARARWARDSPDPCRRLTPPGVGRGLAAGTPGSGPPSLGLSFHIHKPGRSLSGGRVSGLFPKAKRTPSLVLFPSEVRLAVTPDPLCLRLRPPPPPCTVPPGQWGAKPETSPCWRCARPSTCPPAAAERLGRALLIGSPGSGLLGGKSTWVWRWGGMAPQTPPWVPRVAPRLALPQHSRFPPFFSPCPPSRADFLVPGLWLACQVPAPKAGVDSIA